MAEAEKVKCLVETCDQNGKWKGLCGKCYHQAKTLIDENKTTWEELAEMGLASVENKRLLTAFLAKKKAAACPVA